MDDEKKIPEVTEEETVAAPEVTEEETEVTEEAPVAEEAEEEAAA